MASAMELEKFLANSPYLPSFELLTRSRHKGSAMARISSSVFSTMLTRGSPDRSKTGFEECIESDMLVFLASRAFSDLMDSPIEKKTLKINNLEHVLIGKVIQLFRNML